MFQSLAGVTSVKQGFIQSIPPHDSFSEGVIVHFDPAAISLEILIEIHLRTHTSTSQHTMRGKYRSAVYCFSETQRKRVANSLKTLSACFDDPLVTHALNFAAFEPSDAHFQNYYVSGPERPFCKNYIDPKLRLLRKEYGERITSKAKQERADS